MVHDTSSSLSSDYTSSTARSTIGSGLVHPKIDMISLNLAKYSAANPVCLNPFSSQWATPFLLQSLKLDLSIQQSH